jgi:hypothetical protein
MSILLSLGRLSKNIPPDPRPFLTIRNKFISYCEELLAPKLEQLQLLILNVPSYPLYLEAVSSILSLRTRHAVVTRDPLNVVYSTSYAH